MCCFSPVTAPFSLLRWILGPPRVHVAETRIFARVEATPAGAAEWQAFVRDSEGNLVGLAEWR